jgi:hypothetical protein
MLRHTDITIDAEGRDQGKSFRVNEMAAEPAEWWAFSAMQGAIAAGIPIPDEIVGAGMAGLANLAAVGGVWLIRSLAGIERNLLKELLDQMFECVETIPPNGPRRKPLAGDIEEISTRIKLRKVWWDLQFGFFLAAKPSTSEAPAADPVLTQ